MTYVRTIVAMTMLCLLAGCFGGKSSMTEYMPIERVVNRNQIKLNPRPDWRTPQHLAHVQEVFKASHVNYKYKNGKVLIKKDLAEDWQTLAEYTMQANDPDWKKKAAQPKTTAQPAPRLNSGWTIQSGGGR